MDQDLFKVSLTKKELVYGGGLFCVQKYCPIYGKLVWVMRVGKDEIVMLIVAFVKIWNKIGILSLLWCFLAVCVRVLLRTLCGVSVDSLVWRYGCGSWLITGLLYMVLALVWYGTMEALGSLATMILGIMVQIFLRSRRWEMQSTLGHDEDVLEISSFGGTSIKTS